MDDGATSLTILPDAAIPRAPKEGASGRQSLSQRQREVEHRPVAGLAGDSDLAAMSFHDGFGNGEAHAGALDLQALIAAAVELFEDQRLVEVLDPRAAVGDADHQRAILHFSGDLNRRSRS